MANDLRLFIDVARDASGIDIKKAYRTQSLKHHPDKGGDEDQFKLVNEAYSVSTILHQPTIHFT